MSSLSAGSSKWTLNGSDIYRNSNVGIGTSTPLNKLQIDGTSWVGSSINFNRAKEVTQ